MIVEKKIKQNKSTWDVLAEVDDLLQDSPGWENVDWKGYRRKLQTSFVNMRFTGDKRHMKENRARFKR